MNWKLIIENTRFSDQTECIVSVFNRLNVRSLEHVRNLPANVKQHFCGVDLYKLIEEINTIFLVGFEIVVEDDEEIIEEDGEMEEN